MLFHSLYIKPQILHITKTDKLDQTENKNKLIKPIISHIKEHIKINSFLFLYKITRQKSDINNLHRLLSHFLIK